MTTPELEFHLKLCRSAGFSMKLIRCKDGSLLDLVNRLIEAVKSGTSMSEADDLALSTNSQLREYVMLRVSMLRNGWRPEADEVSNSGQVELECQEDDDSEDIGQEDSSDTDADEYQLAGNDGSRRSGQPTGFTRVNPGMGIDFKVDGDIVPSRNGVNAHDQRPEASLRGRPRSIQESEKPHEAEKKAESSRH